MSARLDLQEKDPIIFKTKVPGPQTKRRPEKGGKLNTSQAGSVAASRAAVGQFLSISREVFILRTRYSKFYIRLGMRRVCVGHPLQEDLSGRWNEGERAR